MSKCKCKGVAYITPTLRDECVLRSFYKIFKKYYKRIEFFNFLFFHHDDPLILKSVD